MDATSGTTTIRATIIIGQKTWLIDGFEGTESINAPFYFRLFLAPCPQILSDHFLGQKALLLLENTAAQKPVNGFSNHRKLSGVITQHRHHNPYTPDTSIIELTFEPAMVLSKLSGEPRVFTRITSLELVFKLLKQHGYTKEQLHFPEKKQARHPRMPHWVQAPNETDFEFIHRLLSREGINYFWQAPNRLDQEMLYFYENHFAHPFKNECLTFNETSGFTGESQGYVFQIVHRQKTSTYQVEYVDFDPQNPERAMKATFGNGNRKVVVWGYGAKTYDDLKRAIRQHHERLVMHHEEFGAKTHNIDLKVGYICSMIHLPKFITTHRFHILEVKHVFKSGAYDNHIKLIPHTTPIRPAIQKRKAGQTIHTAVIHSEDDAPYLNQAGEYTFTNHIHHSERQPDEPMTAPRLTPFGGKSVLNQNMGMHFPLRKNAEVLVMYLHNDFNQPILQNSPDNGINTPPIRQDNSWQNVIKTAWGQFLLFSDKKGQESITLAGPNEHNRLALAHPNTGKPYIELISQRGRMTFDAKEHLEIQSRGSLSATADDTLQVDAEKNIRMDAQQAHQQSLENTYHATSRFRVKSGGTGEISAPTIELKAQDKMTLAAKGRPVQIELDNGDMAIEVDEITISALQQIKLLSEGAAVVLNPSGIELNAKTITLAGQPAMSCEPVEDSTPVPPVVSTCPDIGPFRPIKPYPINTIQVINKPNWSHSLHFTKDRATLEVDIRGFTGDESGQVVVARYCHQDSKNRLPVFPAIRHLQHAEEVQRFSFKLGDESIYPDKERLAKSPGSATLNIELAVEDLITNTPVSSPVANEVYYARVTMNGVNSEYYSGPLLIITATNIKIITDRNRPYQKDDAIIGLLRSLPDNLKQQPGCPTPKVLKYYREENRFKSLIIGRGNEIHLAENGIYRELIGKEKAIPLHKQNVRVDADDAKKQVLTRLMPPMIADLRHARKKDGTVYFEKSTPDARVNLTPDEIEYIKNNGNNLTVFIHGFSVPMGSFGHHLNDIIEVDTYQRAPSPNPVRYAGKKLSPVFSEAEATIYRDQAFLKKQFPQYHFKSYAPITDIINGVGVCEWITHLEQHLNEAAGFDGTDYSPFTRCLYIVWPGAVANPLDYMHSVHESVRMGEVVAELLQNIRREVPGINLHVIAHSQGNGVLLHALEKLGETGSPIDHAIFWQAAIPNDALSDRGLSDQPIGLDDIAKAQQTNPWFCPYAHKGSKRLTILHSKNDNILGRLLTQKEQPFGVRLKDVWHEKPLKELGSALFLARLSLESVYQLAVQLNAVWDDFFDKDKLERLWKTWIAHHPRFYCVKSQKHHDCAQTLEAQYRLLVSLKQDGFNDGLRRHLQDGKIRFKQLLYDYFASNANDKTNQLIDEACQDIAPANRLSSAFNAFKQGFLVLEKALTLRRDDMIFNLKNEAFKQLAKQSPTIASITTFVHTVLMMNEQRGKPAMGYEGLDLQNQYIKKILDSEKIKSIETTKWLWEHSHMKNPNENIKKEIYQEAIFNDEQGIQHFGTYDIKNNR